MFTPLKPLVHKRSVAAGVEESNKLQERCQLSRLPAIVEIRDL